VDNLGPVAPVITSAPVTLAAVGQLYTYDVNASGVPSPGYQLLSAPEGMVIDGISGLIEWTPTVEGLFDVTVEAFNTEGSDTQGFTINVAPAGEFYSLWSPDVSVGPDSGNSGGIEAGVKFRADVDGYITGIRFYKYPLNTGTHTGNLWAMNGTNLGRVTFSSETASGWQQADFATPIPITANTTYIASYHAPNGHYARSQNFFTLKGVDNPPLHALRSLIDGVNGVYLFSPTTAFPSQPSSADNCYWVDVVFEDN